MVLSALLNGRASLADICRRRYRICLIIRAGENGLPMIETAAGFLSPWRPRFRTSSSMAARRSLAGDGLMVSLSRRPAHIVLMTSSASTRARRGSAAACRVLLFDDDAAAIFMRPGPVGRMRSPPMTSAAGVDISLADAQIAACLVPATPAAFALMAMLYFIAGDMS